MKKNIKKFNYNSYDGNLKIASKHTEHLILLPNSDNALGKHTAYIMGIGDIENYEYEKIATFFGSDLFLCHNDRVYEKIDENKDYSFAFADEIHIFKIKENDKAIYAFALFWAQ